LTPAETGIKVALDYIQEHIDRRITLDDLSQVSGLSPNHFMTLTKKAKEKVKEFRRECGAIQDT
jgi:AraC-like DNA-binding protein